VAIVASVACLHIGFLVDPIESLVVGHDTSLALMLESRRRGHLVSCFEQRDLTFCDGGVTAAVKNVDRPQVPGDRCEVTSSQTISLSSFDAVFLRKDPPVDVEYLHATQLVELARRPLMVNAPAALRDANEKLYALRFPDLVPRSLVSRDIVELRAFLDDLGGEMIIKPIDGFAGRGVCHVRKQDRNTNSLIELATDHGRTATVAQEYLAASRRGDKRVILIDGRPQGAVLRVPLETEVRANLATGARPERTSLTERDLEICSRLAPDLRRRGLAFVGLDIIGEYLTEVNVTSPTGIEEINALDGISIERNMLDFVERRVAERRALNCHPIRTALGSVATANIHDGQ
jgi:glutathione synthase